MPSDLNDGLNAPFCTIMPCRPCYGCFCRRWKGGKTWSFQTRVVL